MIELPPGACNARHMASLAALGGRQQFQRRCAVYYTMAAFMWARALLNAMLTSLTARPAGALLTTPSVVLYTAGPTPGPNSAVADFTEADFSGYAAEPVTPSAAVELGTNSQALVFSALFVATTGSPFVGNVILGYLLTDAAAAYYGGEQFPEPLSISQAGQFLQINGAFPANLYVVQ